MKLDYNIKSLEERKKIVEQIVEETPQLSSKYLEILADYLIIPFEREEKRKKKILTENRMVTVNKREKSFEGLIDAMDGKEDGIYNLMSDSKTIIFQPKISITQEDLDTIPFLKQLRDSINSWERASKQAEGKLAYIMKKALIEMRKDQYVIKQAYQCPIIASKLTRNSKFYLSIDDESYLDNNQNVVIQGISLMNPKVVSAILNNYSKLKEDSWDQLNGDIWYLIQVFEDICEEALEDYPVYKKILELKIDKVQNTEIQKKLMDDFGITYAAEYISSLWRNKIPKLIASFAMGDFLIWSYAHNNLPMKKCNRCGIRKPAHIHFFSKNKTSKDGWYSICKSCRNKKKLNQSCNSQKGG